MLSAVFLFNQETDHEKDTQQKQRWWRQRQEALLNKEKFYLQALAIVGGALVFTGLALVALLLYGIFGD